VVAFLGRAYECRNRRLAREVDPSVDEASTLVTIGKKKLVGGSTGLPGQALSPQQKKPLASRPVH